MIFFFKKNPVKYSFKYSICLSGKPWSLMWNVGICVSSSGWRTSLSCWGVLTGSSGTGSILTLWGLWWVLPRLNIRSRNIRTAPVPPGCDSWQRLSGQTGEAQGPNISSRSSQVTRLNDPQLLQPVGTNNTDAFQPGKELRASRLTSQRGVREGREAQPYRE